MGVIGRSGVGGIGGCTPAQIRLRSWPSRLSIGRFTGTKLPPRRAALRPLPALRTGGSSARATAPATSGRRCGGSSCGSHTGNSTAGELRCRHCRSLKHSSSSAIAVGTWSIPSSCCSSLRLQLLSATKLICASTQTGAYSPKPIVVRKLAAVAMDSSMESALNGLSRRLAGGGRNLFGRADLGGGEGPSPANRTLRSNRGESFRGEGSDDASDPSELRVLDSIGGDMPPGNTGSLNELRGGGTAT